MVLEMGLHSLIILSVWIVVSKNDIHFVCVYLLLKAEYSISSGEKDKIDFLKKRKKF